MGIASFIQRLSWNKPKVLPSAQEYFGMLHIKDEARVNRMAWTHSLEVNHFREEGMTMPFMCELNLGE